MPLILKLFQKLRMEESVHPGLHHTDISPLLSEWHKGNREFQAGENNMMQRDNKRVTIHMLSEKKNNAAREKRGVVINLPVTMEELLGIGRKYLLIRK